MAFPTGWGRRCSITIDHTKVPGSLTDFPVLLTKDNLPSEMFDADGSYPALNGGGDIRFSSDSAGATQLACEIVSFVTDNDPANGSAEIWVKVPSVSSSSDTVIYVWYKKAGESQPSASDTYGSQNVWDSNFKMVQHLKDATTSTTSDSTSNANNGSKKGANEPIEANGKIGKGQDFDNNDDYIQISDASSLDFTSEITIEAMVKADSLGGVGYGAGILAKSPFSGSHGAYFFGLVGTSPIKWGFGLNSVGEIYNTTPSTGTWYYAVARYKKNTNWNVYANNSSVVTGTAPNTDIGTDSNNVRIGQYYTSTQRTWDGIIDEVRLSNIYRSDNWIGACYNNQNSPSTFATEGTPESMGTAYTKSIIESSTYTDTITKKQTAKKVSEASTYSDVVNKGLGIIKTETATWTDVVTKAFVLIRSFAEAITWTEVFTKKQTAKRITETSTSTDNIGMIKTIGKYFLESSTYTDVVAKIKTLFKTITESSTYADVVSRTFSMGKLLQEATTWIDRMYGKLNGVNMKYVKKYAEKVGTYFKKYFDI